MAEENEGIKRDYFQEVTNEIIAAMEKGNIPWQKPWDPEVGGNLCPKPFNGKSGRAYTLDNAVRCLIVMGKKIVAIRDFSHLHKRRKRGGT